MKRKDLSQTHPLLHCFAGGVGGTIGSVIMCPLEVLKVRLQSSRWPAGVQRPGPIILLRDVVREEGARALYKGLLPTLVGVLPHRGLFFMNYQFFKCFYHDRLTSPNLVYFMSAVSSSIITSTLTNPIWYVKTRMQLDESKHRSIPATQIIKETWKTHGLRGFFRGLQASYLGALDTALNFAIYEYVKRRLILRRAANQTPEKFNPCRSQLQRQSDAALAMAASFFSKTIAVAVSYPHEVLRTRLREPGTKYRTLIQTVRLIYKDEGLSSFYGGFGTHCLRVVPVTCITLASYELIVYIVESKSWIT